MGMKDKIRGYWDRRAVDYDENVRNILYSPRENREWKRIFSQGLGSVKMNGAELKDAKMTSAEMKILDVGTGPGIVATILSSLGNQVTGIDPSREMLERAGINAKRSKQPLVFVQGDAENLPFMDGSFDAVVCRFVLWNLPHPDKAMIEWKRVLRPGGKVLVIDGTWYDHDDSPLKIKLWQFLSTPLIMLTERRIPRYSSMNSEIKESLWSTVARRPQADVRLLERAGFEKIHVLEDIYRKSLTNLDYLKNGHWGRTFMITGVK